MARHKYGAKKPLIETKRYHRKQTPRKRPFTHPSPFLMQAQSLLLSAPLLLLGFYPPAGILLPPRRERTGSNPDGWLPVPFYRDERWNHELNPHPQDPRTMYIEEKKRERKKKENAKFIVLCIPPPSCLVSLRCVVIHPGVRKRVRKRTPMIRGILNPSEDTSWGWPARLAGKIRSSSSLMLPFFGSSPAPT